MFRSLKNIDSAHQQSRTMFFTLALFCLAITIYAIYSGHKSVKLALDNIYLLNNGQLMTASAHNVKENRPVEAQDHVKRFHEFFFTLDPDAKAIEYNVSQSLYLADASARREYENLKESGYYNDLIQANISQHIQVDSVAIQPNGDAYYAKCYAHEQIIRATTVTTRDLVSECYLRDVSRSANNPHGFLIERWRVIQNQDLSTEQRR
ncbi:conjugative transposon protein TraK [Hymenobacter sp. GOD-10R]|uniref:conjugative transposon protein TraK n=1 Tax=Hymenobacter sp. GOD-10R TaxID=3093922 RepID=UPI002D7923C2|nr:conjugative transposon protein TraK [Hymenobacter sp. GOD-10R]WRQ31953.1 conjugative transposon protein TraK [Hymenobacter sp. GOD-10R]